MMIRFPKFITTLVVVAITSAAVAQNENSRASFYVEQYKDLAIAEMMRTGVPASITLAQGILETGGGQSDLASQANNHFGIKCKSEWTGETMLHDDDAKGECFRKYPSVEASFQDHSDFLKNRPNYAFLFKLDPTDYEGWAKGLRKAGYATNPAYATKLLRIIIDNNLQQFTLVALQKKERIENELFVSHDEKNRVQKEVVYVEKEEPVTIVAPKVTTVTYKQPVSKSNISYTTGEIFSINDTKVLYIEAGTSLFAIANNYNISYKKLLDFNDLNEVDILQKAQLIFLQKKPKKGSKEIHIVEAGENIYEICQKEGIQLVSVLEYNRLTKGMEPAKGERLYLKFPAPVSPKIATNEKPFVVSSSR